MDWGGLRREWFELVCSALFDPQNMFFHTFRNDNQGLVSKILLEMNLYVFCHIYLKYLLLLFITLSNISSVTDAFNILKGGKDKSILCYVNIVRISYTKEKNCNEIINLIIHLKLFYYKLVTLI